MVERMLPVRLRVTLLALALMLAFSVQTNVLMSLESYLANW